LAIWNFEHSPENNLFTLSPTPFAGWQSHQQVDPNFVAATSTLEIGYQVSHLHIQSGLTQSQLAEMVGTRLPSIARLENGSNNPPRLWMA
jgi:DNA-binding XRE family transcriptional regulator